MSSKGKRGLVHSLVGAGFLAASTGCARTRVPARAVTPTVAFGAMDSDVPTGCSPEGTPRVLATHAVPKAGITAAADGDGHVWLRFATTKARGVATEIDATSLETFDADEAPLESLQARLAELRLSNGRRFVAWTEGSVEQGMRVRAATLGPDDVPLSDAADLAYEGSAIGHPVVAVGSHGHGVLAFIESNGRGFQVVAVRMSCATE